MWQQAAPENGLRITQLYCQGYRSAWDRAAGPKFTLGYSREPPAANRWSCHATKRLPSKRARGAHFLSIRPLNRRGSVYLKVIARNQPVVVAGAVLGYAKTTG